MPTMEVACRGRTLLRSHGGRRLCSVRQSPEQLSRHTERPHVTVHYRQQARSPEEDLNTGARPFLRFMPGFKKLYTQ